MGMSGEVREVWGAYHERERLCPEGVRVVEIAHVHYGHPLLNAALRGGRVRARSLSAI